MTPDEETELKHFIQPKNILFLSADLTGSTAIKQRQERRDGVTVPRTVEWQALIQNFYYLTTRFLTTRWEEEKKKGGDLYGKGAEGVRWGHDGLLSRHLRRAGRNP